MQTTKNKKNSKIKHLTSLIKYYLQPTRKQEKINDFIKFLEKKYIINN